MKSKLLKLKEKTALYWCFVFMYAFGLASVAYSLCVRDCLHLAVTMSYMLAVCGWSTTRNMLKKVTVSYDDVSGRNDKLIAINKELSDRYNEELSIAQGLISENKDLKKKLKNARMENSRFKNGGKRHE